MVASGLQTAYALKQAASDAFGHLDLKILVLDRAGVGFVRFQWPFSAIDDPS